MKRVLAVSFLAALTWSATAQTKKKVNTTKKTTVTKTATKTAATQGLMLKNSADSVSYALGYDIGSSIKSMGLDLNLDVMKMALEDVMKGKDGKFTKEQNVEFIRNAMQNAAEKKNETARKAEEEFLTANKAKAGIQVTSEGVQYEIITDAAGAKPTRDDEVKVHYKGSLLDGKTFDSSYDRGEPIELSLGNVIEGWKIGIPLMSVGAKYRFYIPSKLGYGPNGSGPIPGNSTLIFEVELLEIKKAEGDNVAIEDAEQ